MHIQDAHHLAQPVIEEFNQGLAKYGPMVWTTTMIKIIGSQTMRSLTPKIIIEEMNVMTQCLPFFLPENHMLLEKGPTFVLNYGANL